MDLCGRCPDSGILADRQTLAVLRRANLDIFWSLNTLTINGMLGYAKELVSRAREVDRAFLFPDIKAWPGGDYMGTGVAIQMLEK